MKFKIDENHPVEVASLLENAGYDALTVLDQEMGSGSDDDLAAVCKKEDRVLITLDLDFADIRIYAPQAQAGIIILRLKRQDKPYVLPMIDRLIKSFSEEQVQKSLWIVDEERIRIRT